MNGIFNCNLCDNNMDRDLNASLNLNAKVVIYTVSACGELNNSINLVNRDSMKQENNINAIYSIV